MMEVEGWTGDSILVDTDYIKKATIDLGVGANWRYNVSKSANFDMGIAIDNVTNEIDTIQNINYYRRYTVHGRVNFNIWDRFWLAPSAMYSWYGPHRHYIFGGEVVKRFSYERLITSVEVGAWARLGQYLDEGLWKSTNVYIAKIGIANWKIGFAYDQSLVFPSNGYEIMGEYVFGKKSSKGQ